MKGCGALMLMGALIVLGLAWTVFVWYTTGALG